MSDLKLDPATGDLDVSDFIAPRLFTPGEEILAIAQRVLIRVRTFLGEWFADSSIGVPWFQQILAQKDTALAVTLIREAVIGTPGILRVDELTATLDADRLLTMTLKATTTAGPLDLSGVPLVQPPSTSSLWTPAALGSAGCAFLFDPTDAATVTLALGRVASVADLSGHGRTMTPRDAGNPAAPASVPASMAPTYSVPWLVWSNIAANMNLGFYDAADVSITEVFLAVQWTDGATFSAAAATGRGLFNSCGDTGGSGLTDGAVLLGEIGTTQILDESNADDINVRINGGADELMAAPVQALPRLVDAGIISVRRANGGAITLSDGFIVGASIYADLGSSWRGNIGGVVGVSGVNEKQRRRVEGYLAHRQGTQSRLPYNHPYRYRPPTIDD